ncbi:Serine aminopeptidase, S33 [Dillenia turbinata]|uniref:Serine aminopeptidase, S33 n=1 Tax=Dillenia turbinata TaxID=194707 RepID=A0AAN8VTW8_9MAGN
MKHKHSIAEANESSPFGSLTADEFYSTTQSLNSNTSLTRGHEALHPMVETHPAGQPHRPHRRRPRLHRRIQLAGSADFGPLSPSPASSVRAIDHQGHGFSEGLASHISTSTLLWMTAGLFAKFREEHALPGLPAFRDSESLGGAIALLITLREEEKGKWNGVGFERAMCGISGKFNPMAFGALSLFFLQLLLQLGRE